MILMVEDSDYFLDFANNLEQKGYDVDWVKSFSGAIYRIQKNPKSYAYDAVILDLDMSSEGLPDEALETAKKLYSGWAFYKHVLCKIPPSYRLDLYKRTIFFTGFDATFKGKFSHEEYNELHVIGKNEPDALKKTCSLLRKFADN